MRRVIPFSKLSLAELTMQQLEQLGKIEIKKTVGGGTQYLHFGERGKTIQTDVLTLVEPNENGRLFETEVKTELQASYFDLMQQRLHIEVWVRGGSSNLFLNQFLGYGSIPLLDIAQGPFKQAAPIFPFALDQNTPQRQVATVSFTILLEEIWNFQLSFMDWKYSQALQTDGKILSPSIEIKLLSKKAQDDQVDSSVLKNARGPLHWSSFEGQITYRGTYSDLRLERLLITLWNHQLIGKTEIGASFVPLKHCLDSNFIKTDMVVNKPKQITEDNIREKLQTCSIQGVIKLKNTPKYKQQGDIDTISKKEQYLAVHLSRLAVFESLDDGGGESSVFATVDWAGNDMKSSRCVKRPNINETLYFHIPIEEDTKKDPVKLAKLLNDELATKSELTINVWNQGADLNGSTRQHLGQARLCLSQVHYAPKEDKSYTDDQTKQKINFECRMLSTTLKLNSAFMPPSSNSQVTLSVWFQPDLPYPDVDLSRLKAKEEDCMVDEDIEQGIKSGSFQSKYAQVLARNFPEDFDMSDDRRFDQLFVLDQYRQKHLLPYFLSVISCPDTGNVSQGKGIRTLQEVAHFIRCIPFRGSQDYFTSDASDQKVWASPEFVLTLRRGSVEEHALLMASMFRAVKYEDQSMLQQEETDRYGRKKKTKRGNERDETISDRVFVCIGRAVIAGSKSHREEKQEASHTHAWVMTISADFQSVTFWEPTNGKRYELPGRISKTQVPLLKAYLHPDLTDEEKKDIQEKRNFRRQESMRSLKESLEEMEFEQRPAPVRMSVRASNLQGANGGSSNDIDSEESDFLEQFKRPVRFEDLDLKYKGAHNLRFVGRLQGQSKERQDQLKDLDYSSDENNNPTWKLQIGKKRPNKFLQNQEQQRLDKEKQRHDKHLLPVETFQDLITGEPISWSACGPLPYIQIDLVMNHKNIWANLQNQNPACIYYNIIDELKWLPLIRDPFGPAHPLLTHTLEQADKIIIKADEALLEKRIAGDFLKPFPSFYDLRGLEPPLTQAQVEKQEAMIVKEVEIAIRQVRSSKNLATKVTKADQILQLQLDYLEDLDCGRLSQPEDQRVLVEKELLKLVPENYRISILPSFFNYTDPERIRTVIGEEAAQFLTSTESKTMFGIGVKIYPFHNGINSVRVSIARMSPLKSVQTKTNTEKPQQKYVITP